MPEHLAHDLQRQPAHQRVRRMRVAQPMGQCRRQAFGNLAILTLNFTRIAAKERLISLYGIVLWVFFSRSGVPIWASSCWRRRPRVDFGVLLRILAALRLPPLTTSRN